MRPEFAFTDKARPVVQLGLGDTRVPTGSSVWDTARWEDYAGADAVWSGLEPAWLDVSCYCHELESTSGRERWTDRWQPGTASITFTNEDGWADLAGSPGQIAALSLRPGRAVRIGVEIDACGICWLWRGVVDAMRPEYDPVLHDIVTIDCIDVLAEVGTTKLALGSLAPAEGVVARLNRILDAAEWEPTKRILQATTTSVIQTSIDGAVIDALSLTADSAGGVCFGDLDGNIVFRDFGWQIYTGATPADAGIGNVDEGVPGTPAIIYPPYVQITDNVVTWSDNFERADGPVGSNWVLGLESGTGELPVLPTISSGAAIGPSRTGTGPFPLGTMSWASQIVAPNQFLEVTFDNWHNTGASAYMHVEMYNFGGGGDVAGHSEARRAAGFQQTISASQVRVVVDAYSYLDDGSTSNGEFVATQPYIGSTGPQTLRLESYANGRQIVKLNGATVIDYVETETPFATLGYRQGFWMAWQTQAGRTSPKILSISGGKLNLPITDIWTPDAPSLALPNAFTIFTKTRQRLGDTLPRILCGQFDDVTGIREWVISRDADDGDWAFGTSLDGFAAPPLPTFTNNGVTPITGSDERFALSVKRDDGIGMTQAALVTGTGYATTPDQSTFEVQASTTIYCFAFVRCSDVDAAGAHHIGGQTGAFTAMSWALELNAGALRFRVSPNGTTGYAYTVATLAQVAAAFLDGQDMYIGASLDVETTTGNARTAFLVSNDGINWLERNSNTITGAVGKPFNSTTPVSIGARSDGSSPWLGKIYWCAAYYDGLSAANLIWRFRGDEYNAFDNGPVYTDPWGKVWTLSTRAALDTLAVVQSTSLQLFVPDGARWKALEPPRQLPMLQHADRTSPLRIGRAEGAPNVGQEWNGWVYSVEMRDGGNPNLPGQTVWKMDLNEFGTGLVLTEPFNNLTNAPWTGDMTIVAGGRTGTAGQILGSGFSDYTIPAANESATITAGFAYKVSNITTNRLMFVLRSDTDTIPHITTVVLPTGAITVLRGGVAGALLGTTAAGTIVAGTWAYIELQTFLHDTNGTVKLRVNGVELLNLGPVDTKSGGTKTTFDTARLNGGGTGVTTLYDDLYISTGAWTDPRGRVWNTNGSAANIIDPPDVAAVATIEGDVCPTGWENSFDRAEVVTVALINRVLPDVPPLRYYYDTGYIAPTAGIVKLNNATQTSATEIAISSGTSDGVQAGSFLRNLAVGSVIKMAEADDTGNKSRSFRVTGPAVSVSGYYTVPVAWTEGETAVAVGYVTLTLTIPPLVPYILDDATGRTLYGIQPAEVTDLITLDSALFPAFAQRMIDTRGYQTMPRVDAVTLDAGRGDEHTMITMATCRPETPSRYRCRLKQGERLVFDRMMFATGIRHFISRDSWTLRITLDDASGLSISERWDQSPFFYDDTSDLNVWSA